MSTSDTNDLQYDGRRRQVSLAFLVLANLLPVFGVLIFDWDVAALMILYWSENLVLGFYTLAKMLVISPFGNLFYAAFFCIHYGGFCAAHGSFIIALLISPEAGVLESNTEPQLQQILALAPPIWLYAFAALMLSHGASFVFNFLLGVERKQSNAHQLMTAPYGRIVVLHVTTILGAFAVVALGQPLAMLLVLVALKVLLDLRLHLREHTGKQRKLIGKHIFSTNHRT